MYTTPPSTPQKQPQAPLKIKKQIAHVQTSPKASRRRLQMDADITAPVFLKTLLMQTTANRKLLLDIKEGVARVIQEATEHSVILRMKITACDEIINDIKKMISEADSSSTPPPDSFPPPPPASPEPKTPEPAGGIPEAKMTMSFMLT
jgi:hypothetical protein